MEESIHFLIGQFKKTFYNRFHYIRNDTTLLSRDSLNVIYNPFRNQPNWVQWNGIGILFVALLKIEKHEPKGQLFLEGYDDRTQGSKQTAGSQG